MFKKVCKRFLGNRKAIILIILGALSWSLVMIRSGWQYDFGLGFWGPNGHDGIWHLALAQSLARGSWQMPTFSGETLTNYHFGFDLILALLHRVTTIPINNLYFQVLPPILALLTGILVYSFVWKWRRSKTQAWWATFLVFFGGSFGWIITLVREGRLGGESMFWAQQAVSTLINPPFALSLVLIFLGLNLLVDYQELGKKKEGKRKRIFFFLLISLIFGVLIQIKAYAGFLSLGALFLAGFYRLFKKKKFDLLGMAGLSTLISLSLFLPFNKDASGLIVFQPFWFLETMMQLSDRLGWPRFGEAMINYKWGRVWFKAIPAYTIAFLIFWYGNLGTRFLGELVYLKWLRKEEKISEIAIFVLGIIFAGGLIPLLFLQKGTPWNTIQFFYYSLTFSGILAGIAFGGLLETIKRKNLRNLLIIGLVLLTVPTTISTLKDHYLTKTPPAKIGREELEALDFLSQQPEGITLTYPFDFQKAEAAKKNPPRPLYLYESTGYVSAFANKPVFLEDEVNANIMGYDWQTRREEILKWQKTMDQNQAYNYLRENQIKYIYWLKGQRAVLGEEQLGITRIFENSEVDIYQVD